MSSSLAPIETLPNEIINMIVQELKDSDNWWPDDIRLLWLLNLSLTNRRMYDRIYPILEARARHGTIPINMLERGLKDHNVSYIAAGRRLGASPLACLNLEVLFSASLGNPLSAIEYSSIYGTDEMLQALINNGDQSQLFEHGHTYLWSPLVESNTERTDVMRELAVIASSNPEWNATLIDAVSGSIINTKPRSLQRYLKIPYISEQRRMLFEMNFSKMGEIPWLPESIWISSETYSDHPAVLWIETVYMLLDGVDLAQLPLKLQTGLDVSPTTGFPLVFGTHAPTHADFMCAFISAVGRGCLRLDCPDWSTCSVHTSAQHIGHEVAAHVSVQVRNLQADLRRLGWSSNGSWA